MKGENLLSRYKRESFQARSLMLTANSEELSDTAL